MLKRVRFFSYSLSLLAFISTQTQAQTQKASFLKAGNKQIVNEDGESFILRGMGLGGWMLQEGYMFRLSEFGQQHRIRAELTKLAGEQKTKWFYDQWLLNHTRKIDIDSMASWGFNSIRLPMHYNLYTKAIEDEPVKGIDTWLEQGFAITDSLLAWCKANNMYLILDLHAAPGGQGHDLNISDRDTTKVSLWDSEENQRKTVALWKKLAQRYANDPWIGGYDIINEPNWGFEDAADKQGARETKNAPLRKLMMDITKAIREVDQKHIIIIEGNRWGNSYKGIMPLWDSNMAISFHKYGNHNDQQSIQQFLDLRDETNAPVWLGESGENSNTWFTGAITLVEKNGIGWAWWQEKKMGINNPLEIKISPGYQKMLDYWFNKGPKPSQAEAGKTLEEVIRLLRLENNIYHKDVIDAMFTQVNQKLGRAGARTYLPVPVPYDSAKQKLSPSFTIAGSRARSFGNVASNVGAPPIFSETTRSFKLHILKNTLKIQAVDYDLGAAGVAYYDTDTASYHFASPPSYGAGNRGYEYRNDGVDIEKDSSVGAKGFVVFKIEDGEWMKYKINVHTPGSFEITVDVNAGSNAGNIAVFVDDLQVQGSGGTIAGDPHAGKHQYNNLIIGKILIPAGNHSIFVRAYKGGFKLRSIEIRRKN